MIKAVREDMVEGMQAFYLCIDSPWQYSKAGGRHF